MKVPGRELVITVVWLAIIGGAFAAFYFLAGPGARKAPQAPPAHREAPPAPQGEEEGPRVGEESPRPEEPGVGAEESPGEARKEPAREPKRIFADSFDGPVPDQWEELGDSKTITVERSDNVLRVGGRSGSIDWDEAGLRTRPYELDSFWVFVNFTFVSNEGTGTKMFYLSAEDADNEEAKAWVYFHPTSGGRENAGYAAMKQGGSTEGFDAPDGGKALHTLCLAWARGKLAAFVDTRRIATYEMKFRKVRFALGLKSPAEGEKVEAVFDSFCLLDWPEKPYEP